MQLSVYNKNGEKAGTIDVRDDVFAVAPHEDAMHLSVVAYLSNQRQGNAKTKTRDQVSGGGKKPWKQKGRGTARSGSTRSPVWVGGGTVFGPQPHTYKLKVTKQVKKLARKSALSLRAAENSIYVIEDFNLEKPKTKEFASLISNLKLTNISTLIVVPDHSDNLYRSARNLSKINLFEADKISTYQILSHKKMLVFKGAIEKIESSLINS